MRQADLKSRHKLMSDKLNELRVDASEKDRELQLMNQRLASHTAKLKGLQDVKEARKSHLIQKNPGLREAMEWVESNRHRFKGEVFGPLGLEVTVHQPEHAQYLEQHCSQRLWGVRSPAAAPVLAGSCIVSTRPRWADSFRRQGFVTHMVEDRTLLTQECPGKPDVYHLNSARPCRSL